MSSDMTGVKGQIALDLPSTPDFSAKNFVAAPSNKEALSALALYPKWANAALAIIGPKGSGKTHIGSIWQSQREALKLECTSDVAQIASWRGHDVWIDDASQAHEELLFALINMAIRADITGLLLTDEAPPSSWPMQIKDLRSRLGAMQVVRLCAPDDDLLGAIMGKLFLDRGLKVSQPLITYLTSRIERSVDAAAQIVEELDKAAAAKKANVTRSFAMQYFEARQLPLL